MQDQEKERESGVFDYEYIIQEIMRKILIRAAMPFEGCDNISEILVDNLVGNNAGNLIYQRGVMRAVMTQDTQITTIRVNRHFSDEEMDMINSEYEMFLIPLANALRASFKSQLKILTKFIKNLKIPCVVIGVGLQRSVLSTKWEYNFDEEAKEFIIAVLEKSALLGLRGEVTGEYFKRLGFAPEKDFTVIGCPSMYTYGDVLPKPRLTDLTPESRVAVNFKATLDKNLYKYIRREASRFDDYVFVSQVIKEIKNLYVGCAYPKKEMKSNFPEDHPIHFDHELMLEGRMVGFLDVKSWIDFLKEEMDFGFGSRIHGDIANILAGIPCYIFTDDCRVKELAQYHNIPYKEVTDINEDTDIFKLYEKTDYGMLMRGHEERVTHYLDFLDCNKVKHLDRETLNSLETPFDIAWKDYPEIGPIRPFSSVSLTEQERRIQEYLEIYEDLEEDYRELKKTIKKKVDEYQKEQEKLKKELMEIKSRKFYKLQLKYDRLKKKIKS